MYHSPFGFQHTTPIFGNQFGSHCPVSNLWNGSWNGSNFNGYNSLPSWYGSSSFGSYPSSNCFGGWNVPSNWSGIWNSTPWNNWYGNWNNSFGSQVPFSYSSPFSYTSPFSYNYPVNYGFPFSPFNWFGGYTPFFGVNTGTQTTGEHSHQNIPVGFPGFSPFGFVNPTNTCTQTQAA
ncbi:MAG: hypothetical protein H6810_06905 [Phycisphaeraceae bacterium]|nr:MAG: hypothetical protein H6810_06905 [Phycisphaeraceae bacterium]